MKLLTIVKSCFLMVIFGLSSTSVEYNTLEGGFNNGTLITCITWPWCGGPDVYSPVLEPKDDKSETKDTKDIKLA